MRVKVGRKARRLIEDAGGIFTLEARAKAGGCLIKTDLQSYVGKPPEPALFQEAETSGMRIFTRGVLERPDGSTLATDGALPGTVRIRESHGRLVAEAG